MHVTFLATVNLDDLSDLAGTGEEIADAISQIGIETISVTPWARPSLQQIGAVPTPSAVPTTPVQPLE